MLRAGRWSSRCCGAAAGADRRPILLVHGINPVSPQAPFVDLLAEHGEVIAPSMPGFGGSPLPEDFDTMYDLVHVWRDVLDALPDRGRDDRVLVRRLGRGRDRGRRSSEARPARAGRSGRRQAGRPRGARHRPFLQHEPGRAEPARLARSRQAPRRRLRAGLAGLHRRRDAGRGDGQRSRATGIRCASMRGGRICTTRS